MDEITSIAYLASVVGTAAFVLLVTQYVKKMLPEDFNIRLFVLLLCAATQIGLALIGGADVEQMILSVANSFVAATSAMGAYEVTFRKTEKE